MPAVMGVDPGTTGGIAVLAGDGAVLMVKGFKPGLKEREVCDILQSAITTLRGFSGTRCYFEKVGYKRGDGGKGAFTFGDVNGFLRGALSMAHIDIKRVYPMMWQARMECLTGGNKNVSKNRAIELFPQVPKITHATADALLIAEYGRRQEQLGL